MASLLCKKTLSKSPLSTVLVVAAVLIDEQNRLLLTQRPKGKSLAGLWEFPGGKIQGGELPERALTRELHEELGIHVAPESLSPLTFASYAYPDFHLLMPLYACRTWRGKPHPREGQELAWVQKSDMPTYVMPPADEQILPIVLQLI